LILAVAAAAVVGALGAVILGEYPYTGPTVLVAGAILGLFVGEAAVAVAGVGSLPLAMACSAVAAVAMVWGAWISTGRDLSFLGLAGWTSVALAGLAGFMRTALKTGSPRPAADTPPEAPTPGASPGERPA